MYYALKEFVNYDPVSLAKKCDEECEALDKDERFPEAIFELGKTCVGRYICILAGAIAAILGLILSFTSKPIYVLILLVSTAAFHYRARELHGRESELLAKPGALIRDNVSPASEYYHIVRNSRTLACYGRVDEERDDLFELTVVTVPLEGLSAEDSDAAPSESKILIPFDKSSLCFASGENLVFDLGSGIMRFVE